MQVEGWLTRAAAAQPQRTAIETPQESWSYAELLEAARAGASELAARGAQPGARVAIVLGPGLAFAQALHACLLLGAVAVPVDPRLTPAERSPMLEGAAVLVQDPLSDGRRPHAALAGREAKLLRSTHPLDATAAVLHTSGTTSTPQPVALTYGNFLWSAIGSAVALGSDREERWLCALPLCHVGGLSILLRSCIYATTAVVHESFQTDSALAALANDDITLVSLVATTLARLLDAGLREPPALRCALTGGGPVSPKLVARAREAGVPVGLTYGLTEACSQVSTEPVASLSSGAERALGRPSTVGLPLFCTRVQIAADGEILVRGPTVAPGALEPDGWLHTGDLGSLDGEGRLSVAARKADTIISGGENVAPAEVEAALESHPEVIEAGVLGLSDPRWGEAVAAVVLARPGSSVTGEALRAHCALALAHYKMPKQVTLVTEPLPRTASGKLLRRELAQRYALKRSR